MRSLFVLGSLFALSVRAQVSVTVLDTLHWNSQRRLKIADFHMAPQDFTGMAGESNNMLMVDFKKPSPFLKTTYHTHAIFDRSRSWFDPRSQETELLDYFQVVFDLYELHARLLKKDLVENGPKGDPTMFMNERYSSWSGTLSAQFYKFREESRMGQKHDVVVAWGARVRAQIEMLGPYAEE